MTCHAVLQIYNDNIHDLLAQHDHRGKANLKLREDNRGRAYVDNLTEVGAEALAAQELHEHSLQQHGCSHHPHACLV